MADGIIEHMSEFPGLDPQVIGSALASTRLDSAPDRARSLRRLLPAGAVVAGRTAAWLWGLDVFPPGQSQADHPLELALAPGRTPPRCRWARFEALALPADDIAEAGGVPVTIPARTAFDCARRLPRLDAVAAVDQFLRRGVDARALAVRAEAVRGRPRTRQLREVIALGDPGAASPGESWTRARIIDAGLPRPRTQIKVPGPDGRDLRIDLGDQPRKVAAEYDGAEFHTTPEAMAHDAARRSWLRGQGWILIVATKHDVLLDPRAFLSAYLAALLGRGWHPDDDRLCTIYATIARPASATRRRLRSPRC